MTSGREAPPVADWVEVADDVLVLREHRLHVTTTAVVGPTGVVVVDAGAWPRGAAWARARLEERTGLPVVGLVLTHAHYDHTFGAVAYAGVPTYGHGRLAEHLRVHEAAELAAGRAGELELDGDPGAWDDVVLPVLDVAVTGTTTIRPGGRDLVLEAWPTAHTTCDLVVHVPDAGVWVVGDVVEESAEPSFETDSDPVGWAAAVGDLAHRLRPDDVVVPGHGATVGQAFVAGQARVMSTLAATLVDARRRGATEAGTVRELRAATGWHGGTLRRAARAHGSHPTTEELP